MTLLDELVAPVRPADPPAPGRDHLPERMGWSVACLLVVFSGLHVWVGSMSTPGANASAMVLVLGGLVGMWWCWIPKAQLGRRWQAAVLLGLTLGLAMQAVAAYGFDPAYGTDAVAFDHYAALLLLHGHDPYAASMAPALARFHVPVIFSTYTMTGGRVTHVSYPAGSFLLYVPFLAAGLSTQAGNIADIAFWVVGLGLAWLLLPRRLAWLAPLLLGAPMYAGYVLGGVTDTLFLPFLVVALWRWDRYGDHAHGGLARWVGPVMLGLAMTVKQTPWFLLPFLLVGVAQEAQARDGRGLRTAARYAAVTATTFLAVNAAFIVWGPKAWLQGAFAPLLDPTIPDGQGVVNAVLYGHVGGGDLQTLSLAGAAFLAGALLAFAVRYPALKRGWALLVALAFFWPTRSFGSYLIMMVPAALVAAATVRPAPNGPGFRLVTWFRTRARAAVLLAVPAAVLAGGVGVALAAPAPLSVDVVATRSTGQLQTVDQITVRVRNRTGRALRPHFTVNSSGHVTTFWYAVGGTALSAQSQPVPPHGVETVTLRAPNVASMPSLSAPFMVEAFTGTPPAVSVSAPYLITRYSTTLSPSAVNAPVPVGQPVTLTVQLRDRFGSPVRTPGVTITLGQTVYTQSGPVAGESSIDGGPEGASPVSVRTDARGRARFVVAGVQPQDHPVYYQAWIDPGGHQAPYGYSDTLTIQYVAATP